MSIRYTLRHNIPSDKLAEEDVNDSSTWDLNLLRKHELAETDNHDIVYRTHDGEVVNWADAATQQANEILEEVQGISTDIDNQVTVVENRLAEIEEEAVTLTQEAQEANEAAQQALVQAGLAVTESQENADSAENSSSLAQEWASKMDGIVNNTDYSSKYYAQQAGASATSASSSASTATTAKDNAQTSATNASNSSTLAQQWATKTDGKVDSTDYSAKHYALSCVDSATSASQSATSAASSASTATTKAQQASSSATSAQTSASSAQNSATQATTKASEASASASSASQSATSASQSATSASTSATNASASATSASASATSAQTSADAAEQAREDIQAYYGVPVGFEFFSMNPNVPDGTLPLLGGEYSREMYASLWEWVQTQTGYLVSESTWAALSNTNNGNVPYYSDGDGSTTFRVPALKCWIKGKDGTETVGTYLDAGLPNITGNAFILSGNAYSTRIGPYSSGSIRAGAFGGLRNASTPVFNSTQNGGSPAENTYNVLTFNASSSNSIYGNSSTVQPESIVGMWLVKAYGAVVDNGSIDVRDYIDEKIEEIDKFRIPLGYEYFTFNPHIPQGSLPLFGGEYSRVTYSDLWNWVQQQTGYLKTESEWQTLATAHNGNVPYYSDGDGLTTFRVPSLKCWIKGANGTVSEVGSYLEAGLPNITGTLTYNAYANNTYSATGALVTFDNDTWTRSYSGSTTTWNSSDVSIDASRSSSIYGNSTTVQPESIVGMWLVKAYGTVVDTGQIDEQQYIDDRIATCLPLTGGTMLGAIHYNGTNNRSFGFDLTNNYTNMDIGWNWTNRDGAGIGLRSTDDVGSTAGSFSIYARDGSNDSVLKGSPNGSLTWGGYNVITTKYQSVTTQYVSNSVVSQTQFARNSAWVSNGFLFVQINMNFTSGATTSEITTVGKLKNVNIITDIIEVAIEQNATFKPGLLCLYNNGSDVDIRVYTTTAAGGGRYGHWFTVPLR